MKTPIKVSIKVQRIIGTHSRMRSRMSITFKCIFPENIIFNFFLRKGNTIFLTFIHIYGKYHISMYSLRKIVFHFPSKEKISYFPEKKNISPDNTRKIKFQLDFFWKDHLFGAFEESIIFPCIFSRKIIFHFPFKE